MKTAKRCRNCKYCIPNSNMLSWCRGNYCICNVRTWGKKNLRHYAIKPSNKACDLFESKDGHRLNADINGSFNIMRLGI